MYYPFVFLTILSIEKVPPNPSLSFFFAKKCLPTLSKPKGKRNYKCHGYLQGTLIHGYIKTPNMNFVFWLQSMPYDVKTGPH